MKITVNNLPKSQVELIVEIENEEFKSYIEKGAKKLSGEIKIEGFRPGKAPYDLVKQKVGEMAILEEAAHIAINDTLYKVIGENLGERQPVGQPAIDIIKLAPGNNFEYKITVALVPEVTLGDYHDAKVKEAAGEIKEEDVEKVIARLRESRVKEIIADREAQDGDKVILDVEMFLDKVPVDGGQSKGVAVIIGKDYFVPGFDKKIIGLKRSETREFNLPYPKDFYQANLAGKLVEFRVKLAEVYSRELPELTDDFAKGFGANGVESFKGDIKKELEHGKKHEVEQKAEIEMLDKILAKTKFSDIPEILVQSEAETMLAELERTVTSQGGNFDDYLIHIGKTRDQMTLDILPEAVKRVKSTLMVREIANKEKIEVSEEEIDKKIEELLKQYHGYEKVTERLKEKNYRGYVRHILTNGKVIKKLREWNVEK
jgi:trigger factor